MRALVLALLVCSTARAEQSAESILKASGLSDALVVHLGCGDGKVTAALASGDASIVQGLDTDPANVERTIEGARAEIIRNGIQGAGRGTRFHGEPPAGHRRRGVRGRR